MYASPDARSWKGKERAIDVRDEGAGGKDGIIIPLQLLTSSAYESVYVAPIRVGPDNRQFLVQVDTGSSDLWLASTACSSSDCNNVGGSRYDSSQSLPTGQTAQVFYAEGEVDGPVVWDTVQLGGYSIDNQALIAAANVNAEPLSSSFVGVLGLALPLNSVIAQKIPTATNDVADGAALSANLFSITPASAAPPSRFFSVSLERPGSDQIPSLLGIGRHPKEFAHDASKIQYAPVVSENTGSLFWQANVRAITAYVNGQPKHINLPLSGTGTNGQPSAILDTGVPLIIASPEIAYGIYGALGYSPAADGNVYVPCNKPLNITITLDDRSEIPLHPLDLTYYPPDDPSADNCIGAIQTPDHIGLKLYQADIVLGVPFLRNTYTVLAYDEPDAQGAFPPTASASARVEPRLGLLALTDPATAADEFHQVRVLKQPLSGSRASTDAPSHKGLSVGVEVLIGLLGFFGLCFVLFGARLVYMKRRWGGRAAPAGADGVDGKAGAYGLSELGYHPAPRKGSHSSEPSEDELRMKRYEAYVRRRELESQYTDDTATTRVEPDADEFGALKARADSPEDGKAFRDPWADTLVDSRPRPPPLSPHPRLSSAEEYSALPSPPPPTVRRSSYIGSPLAHQRTLSGGPSSATPLLAQHARHGSEDIAEFGMPPDGAAGERESMAGIGTSARSRRLGSAGSGASMGLPMPPSSPLLSPSLIPMSPPSPSFAPSSPEAQRMSLSAGPRTLEPVFSPSRNDSRVSVIGHES